jgi:hypothetical protein
MKKPNPHPFPPSSPNSPSLPFFFFSRVTQFSFRPTYLSRRPTSFFLTRRLTGEAHLPGPSSTPSRLLFLPGRNTALPPGAPRLPAPPPLPSSALCTQPAPPNPSPPLLFPEMTAHRAARHQWRPPECCRRPPQPRPLRFPPGPI